MQDTAFLDEFAVLLSDESSTRLELFDRWLPGIKTRFARTERELYSRFDSSVALVFISQSLLGEEEQAIRKAILNRNPYCQLVLIAPRQSFVSPLEDNYDACLQRPIFRDELQTTVEEHLKCGVYSATLYEFYRLNAEVSGFGQSDRSNGSGPADPSDEKGERYRQLKERLDHLQPTIDHDDVDSILRSIELHKRYLTEPERDTESSTGSKYHPARCPGCKLPWGVDHRNELGRGFERVGAYVWRCTRCTKLVHGVGTSHRRVTW
jgi:hypothetical protein